MNMKDCPVEPSKYFVSDKGDVLNKRNGITRKASVTKWGYARVSFYINGKVRNYPVHRLVASAFLPNPDNLPVVNHIDGNKLNNCVDNLEWCTYAHNVRHAVRTGLHVTADTHPRGKLSVEKAWEAWGRVSKGESPLEVASSYGIAISSLHSRFKKMFGKYCPDVKAAKLRANKASHDAKKKKKLFS
jgi:hypothetical protein